MNNTTNIGTKLSSKPLFWGIAGSLTLGGIAYFVSRNAQDKTIIAPVKTTASTNNNSNNNSPITPTPPPTPTPQTNAPTLLTATANQITYSGVANGATLKLYKNGSDFGQSYIADGNAWNGLNLTTGTYTITATESGKTESVASNGIQFSVTTPVTTTPILSTASANQITYSGAANGSSLKLHKNGSDFGQTFIANGNAWTGLTLTTGMYTITATESGKTESVASNGVQYTAASNTNVITTVPDKPAGYFTDGKSSIYYANRNNLPTIFQNTPQFDPINDVVKLSNGVLEVWFDLRKGGQICLFRLFGTTENVVYYGSDGGYEWQIDAATKLVGGVINGQTSSSPQNNVNYNTTQGGSYTNRCPNVLEHHEVQDGYYFKIRPILYPFNDIIAEVEIEITYTLQNDLLKVDYKYTSFRTDSHIQQNAIAQDFVVPVMFCKNNYDHYYCFEGSTGQKWTNLPTVEGLIPNTTNGQNAPIGYNNSESWGVVYDSQSNMAIGVYNSTGQSSNKFIKFEQLNKFSGSTSGTNTTGPYTVLSVNDGSFVADAGNFIKNSTAYITMKPKNQIRQRFQNLSLI